MTPVPIVLLARRMTSTFKPIDERVADAASTVIPRTLGTVQMDTVSPGKVVGVVCVSEAVVGVPELHQRFEARDRAWPLQHARFCVKEAQYVARCCSRNWRITFI
jgi:hypothetical protein